MSAGDFSIEKLMCNDCGEMTAQKDATVWETNGCICSDCWEIYQARKALDALMKKKGLRKKPPREDGPLCFFYIRVSTEDQKVSPEWQASQCQKYYDLYLKDKYDLGGTFEDIGVSAYSNPFFMRPAGSRLNSAAVEKDIIIIAKFDRAFRSASDRAVTEKSWDDRGIDYGYLDLNFDTSTQAGKLFKGMMGLFAEAESGFRSERIKAWHHQRKLKKTPRRKNPPPGWMLDPETMELVPDYAERKNIADWLMWNDHKIQSIHKTVQWLRKNKIKRRSGHSYSKQWLYFSRVYLQENWPCEGFAKEHFRQNKEKIHKKTKQQLSKRRRGSITDIKKRIQALQELPAEELANYFNGE